MRIKLLRTILSLNPIFILSLLNYRVSQYFQLRLVSKTFLNFIATISYPPQINRAFELHQSLFPQLIDQEEPYYFKQELRKLAQIELWSVYKFYNLTHNAQATRFCFHEILRRNLKVSSLFTPFGFSRYLLSHIFLKIIINRTTSNKSLYCIILRYIYFCNNYSFYKFTGDDVIQKCSRVAIVGGAPAHRDNIQEISCFDYVADLNPNSDFLPRSKKILYVRGEKGDQIFQNNDVDMFLDAKVIFVKLFRHYRLLHGLPTMSGKFNSSVFLDYSLDFGKLNAVQCMCFDLLMYKPSEIKVFNTDLNLSKKHRDGYRNKALPNVQFDYIFGEHPAAVQFLFLKALCGYFGINFEENVHFSIHWSYRKFLREFYKTYKALDE